MKIFLKGLMVFVCYPSDNIFLECSRRTKHTLFKQVLWKWYCLLTVSSLCQNRNVKREEAKQVSKEIKYAQQQLSCESSIRKKLKYLRVCLWRNRVKVKKIKFTNRQKCIFRQISPIYLNPKNYSLENSLAHVSLVWTIFVFFPVNYEGKKSIKDSLWI